MNRFKAELAAGRRQIGLWQSLASPYTAEICAGAGFDWLLIDGEHAPNDVPLMLAQLQAVAAYPVEPVVRVVSGDPALIKAVLDIGARSLLVPMVETAAEAAHLVRAARYPPAGFRGVGSAVARSGRWSRTSDYLATANDDLCLLAQVETVRGLANLPEIVATDGVEGVFIGPADLAASLGHLGDPGHPDVVAAIEAALVTIVAGGKAAGILSADEQLCARYLALGATFLAVGTDVTILVRGADALMRRYLTSPDTPSAQTGGSPY